MNRLAKGLLIVTTTLDSQTADDLPNLPNLLSANLSCYYGSLIKLYAHNKQLSLNYHVHLTTFLYGSDHAEKAVKMKVNTTKQESFMQTEINFILEKNGGYDTNFTVYAQWFRQ